MMFIHFLKHEAICVPFLAVDIDIPPKIAGWKSRISDG